MEVPTVRVFVRFVLVCVYDCQCGSRLFRVCFWLFVSVYVFVCVFACESVRAKVLKTRRGVSSFTSVGHGESHAVLQDAHGRWTWEHMVTRLLALALVGGPSLTAPLKLAMQHLRTSGENLARGALQSVFMGTMCTQNLEWIERFSLDRSCQLCSVTPLRSSDEDTVKTSISRNGSTSCRCRGQLADLSFGQDVPQPIGHEHVGDAHPALGELNVQRLWGRIPQVWTLKAVGALWIKPGSVIGEAARGTGRRNASIDDGPTPTANSLPVHSVCLVDLVGALGPWSMLPVGVSTEFVTAKLLLGDRAGGERGLLVVLAALQPAALLEVKPRTQNQRRDRIHKIGPLLIQVRWVKGHATLEHVRECTTIMPWQLQANELADEQAKKGSALDPIRQKSSSRANAHGRRSLAGWLSFWAAFTPS